MKEITGLTLKELDKLHERTENEEIDDLSEENGVLRLKLKILNEYLTKIVESSLKSNYWVLFDCFYRARRRRGA